MRAERVFFGSSLASALGVAGVLIPKCPLCVAAYLCLLGLGAGSARAVVAIGGPLLGVVLAASLLASAWLIVRRLRQSRRRQPHAVSRDATCCASS